MTATCTANILSFYSIFPDWTEPFFYEVAIARRPDQSIRSKITTFHFGSNPIFGMRTTRKRDTKWTRRDAIFIFSFSFWRAPIAARPGDCAVVDGNAATAQKQTPETL